MSENKLDKIPDDIAQEVIELASQLYAEAQKKNEGFSLSELQDIGNEVSIPDEIMTEALTQIQEKYRQKELQKQQQKKQIKILGFVGLGLSLLIALWGISTYNSLNNHKQEVMAKWAQVENQLQRKADLIHSLINITQAQADHEKELITLLNNAREQYLQADTIDEKLASSQQINQAINKVNNYALKNKNLASSEAFSNLQYEIAGTENRIATERKRYNEAVQKYNQNLQSFPNSIIANLSGFKEETFFQSSTNK